MLTYPNIDPIAFELFGLPIRWYGLAYVAGFLCGLYYIKWLVANTKNKVLTPDHIEQAFLWIVGGIIIGGRLGYTMFYQTEYYLNNPLAILQTWHGGMSFHGGLAGVLIACYLFCRKNNIQFFDLMDKVAPGICFGLFFGRLANFANGELFGRVTDSAFGMVFPHGGDLPRHPSQLYEAALEGVVLFIILHFFALKRNRRFEVSGLFLLGYGISRIIVEFFRQPDNLAHLQTGIFKFITMGQILSLPMILFGLLLIFMGCKNARKNP